MPAIVRLGRYNIIIAGLAQHQSWLVITHQHLAGAVTLYDLKHSYNNHSAALSRAAVFLAQPHLCCVQGSQSFQRTLMTYMQMPGKSKCVLATAVTLLKF